MPGPYNYADATFQLSIRGDGRDDTVTIRPVTPQTFVAWSPPGALGTVSPVLREELYLVANIATLVMSAAIIAGMAPYTPTYVAVVPRTGSTVGKTAMGNSLDIGLTILPDVPCIYALPNPIPAGWQILYLAKAQEIVDLYVW